MIDLRILLAAAITGANLSDDPLVETALDRIGALAKADALGSALWRLTYGSDAAEFDRVWALLAKRLRAKKVQRSMSVKISRAVLVEWLDCLCSNCAGRGYMVIPGTGRAHHACPSCAGTTMRRYSDADRVRQIGVPIMAYPKWEKFFTYGHLLLTNADQATWSAVADQLERFIGRAGVREKVLALQDSIALHGQYGIIPGSNRPAPKKSNMPGPTIGSAAGAE